MDERVSSHFSKIIERHILIDWQSFFDAIVDSLHGLEFEKKWGFDIFGSPIADVGLVVCGITNLEGLRVDSFNLVDGFVDGFISFFFTLHSLHIFYDNSFSIFKRILHTVQQGDYSLFLTGYILDDYLDWLFAIFIQHLEGVSIIIQHPTIGTNTLRTDEFNIAGSTLFVKLELFCQWKFCD